jgi:hypothetical protein
MSTGPLEHSEDPKAEAPEEPATKAGPAETPPKSAFAEQWRNLTSYLQLLDFARLPDTKVGWLVRIAVTTAVLVVLGQRVRQEVGPMLATRPPTPIPTVEIDDYRFRLPERTRREIFAELATAELAERQRAIAANTWKGHAWSREDDRGHYERVAARAAAAKYKVSLSQVYLVLDEGIRNKWPAPNGDPLPGTTPPLNLRTDSW